MPVATEFDIPARECSSWEDWRVGPAALTIDPSDVHVWRINLDAAPSPKFESIISDAERECAARFRFARDRYRFVVSRAALRTILARYLDANPAELRFETALFGKPYLVSTQNRKGLRFNLSHSNELALVAVAAGKELGVDVEFIRADFATGEVAENFFSRAEIQQLRSIPLDLRVAAFFNCWTRKEAYIKARGEGLSMPLDQFDVSIAPGEQPALLANRLNPADVSRWSFYQLFPAAGYAATLAVEGTFSDLKLWDGGAIC